MCRYDLRKNALMRIAMPENATKLANDALTYRPLEPLGKKSAIFMCFTSWTFKRLETR
jgi:hypothetical protein